LLALAPASRYGGEDEVSYGSSRYNIGGSSNVSVLIDGSQTTGDRNDVSQQVINPSVEAVQEVQVIENIYSAQYGRDVGALVQIESKSGSNATHGGLYYYNRNEAFDTYQAFTNTKPVDRQHMSGGLIGGAIKKVKLFYFESFENQKNVVPSPYLGTVPAVAEKGGDFSALLQPANGGRVIYDPATSVTDPVTGNVTRMPCQAGAPDCVGTNVLKPAVFDSVAKNLLQYFPDPNQPGIVNNLASTSGTAQTTWLNVTRIDYNASDKDRLSGVWMLNWRQNLMLGVPQYNSIHWDWKGTSYPPCPAEMCE
jgi:hypothetical protein